MIASPSTPSGRLRSAASSAILVVAGFALGLLGAAMSPTLERFRSDSSSAGRTQVTSVDQAFGAVPDAFGQQATQNFNSINPFYVDPWARDHVKLSVTPSSVGCGNDGKEFVRPFYVNSAGSAATFNWCEGKTCYLTLEIGGDALHHDIGMVRMRGCPVSEGYTIPYLRVMKVLIGSYSSLYLGWGACDQAETSCALGADTTLQPGDCKTLAHPTVPSERYDVCYDGQGKY